MAKFKQTRTAPTQGAFESGELQERVIEVPAGFPVPPGCTPVSENTPVSDWAPTQAAPAQGSEE